MLRYLVLVSCFVIMVRACAKPNRCPVIFELQADGTLFVQYRAPNGVHHNKVSFMLYTHDDETLKQVDENADDDSGRDWNVVFSRETPFEACDSYWIRVISVTNGNHKLERDFEKQIPGPDCPETS